MSLFSFVFPREAARLALMTRRLNALMAEAGLDESTDPDLADVVAEIKAGRDVKATQLYCKKMGVGIGEGTLAVAEIRERLGRAG